MANFPSVVNPDDLAVSLVQSKVQETSQSTGVGFLKMDFETGEWLLGQDAEDVTGEEVLVNVATIKHGWILWSGGRPNKSMVGFSFDLPMPMEAVGQDQPAEARSFDGALFSDGTALQFDTSSYGGRKGVDKLLSEIKSNAAGNKKLYPLVKLSSESYANSKRGGKETFNPIFEVIRWCDQDGQSDEAPAELVTDKTEEPTRQRRKRSS
jgi:hypothetical protein